MEITGLYRGNGTGFVKCKRNDLLNIINNIVHVYIIYACQHLATSCNVKYVQK
jgi:hypothetical protein